MTGQTVRCPRPGCGAEVTLATTAERADADGFVWATVVVDKGTAWTHIRDAHPDVFARMCDARRRMNANPNIGVMPRKVNGTFLRAGEDVSDI